MVEVRASSNTFATRTPTSSSLPRCDAGLAFREAFDLVASSFNALPLGTRSEKAVLRGIGEVLRRGRGRTLYAVRFRRERKSLESVIEDVRQLPPPVELDGPGYRPRRFLHLPPPEHPARPRRGQPACRVEE